MTKTGIALVTLAVLLAGAYLYWFTDLFAKPTIQILAQVRPGRASRVGAGISETQVWPVSFAFNRKFGLTEVTVVAVDDAKTNKFPHILWHLISDSNSVPVKALVYGSWPPRGMKSSTPRARPDPLEPEVAYLLTVKADNYVGSVKFKTHEVVRPPEPQEP